jgi:membrane protein
MHVIVALSLSATMILAALVALASVVVAPVALALLPLGPYTGFALDLMRWVVGIGIVLLAVGLLYRFGPSEKAVRPAWRRAGVITPGVIVAVALWALVSWGFSTYLENFGNYDRVYGSLGAVIALLMWLYLSGFVVLLGAIIDVELARALAGGMPGDTLSGHAEGDEPSPAAPARAEAPGRA